MSISSRAIAQSMSGDTTSSRAGMVQLVTLLAGSLIPVVYSGYQLNSGPIELKISALPPTHRTVNVSSEQVDQSLAVELVRVINNMSANQIEMEADAKRILYAKMRSLVRR